MRHPFLAEGCRPIRLAVVTLFVLLPSLAAAQSPWERAANNMALTFTRRPRPLAAIVIGGLMFMFGEGGAKRQISGIVFGGGLSRSPGTVPHVVVLNRVF